MEIARQGCFNCGCLRARLNSSVNNLNYCICFLDKCLALHDLVKVSKLDCAVQIAREIVLECDEDCPESGQVLLHVQRTYNNRIFCVGNKISFPYFGKELVFKITGAEFVDTRIEGEFFATLPDTFWKFRGDIDFQPVDRFQNEVAGLEDIKKDLDRVFIKAFDFENDKGRYFFKMFLRNF